MVHICKYLTLILVIVVTISIPLMVVHTNAQTVTKPSVPTFTVALANHPHYVARTYGVDQYTGATIVRGGYSVDNKT